MYKLKNYVLTTIAFAIILFPWYGYCVSILGVVKDPQGNPVNGCHINIIDSKGSFVNDGRTDVYGRYCITPVEPGTYTLVLDPRNTGVETGSGVVKLQLEGLTVDWKAAKDKPALANATPGVLSKAAASCGAAWSDNTAVAATAFVATGGGVVGGLCGFDVICGGGGNSGPSSNSR